MKPIDLHCEVQFWQELISWYESQKAEPVPERMYQALDLAMERAKEEGTLVDHRLLN